MEPARQISMKAFHSLGIALCSSIPIFLIFAMIFSTSSWLRASCYIYRLDNSTPTIIFYKML